MPTQPGPDDDGHGSAPRDSHEQHVGVPTEEHSPLSTSAEEEAKEVGGAPVSVIDESATEGEVQSDSQEPRSEGSVGDRSSPSDFDGQRMIAKLENLAAAYQEMSNSLEAVGARLDALERVARRQADFVDRLHEENSRLKRGELQSAQLPLLRALFSLYDNVLIGSSRSDPSSSDMVYEILDDLADHVRGVLSIGGIEPFAPTRGESFDASRHRAVAVEDTLEEDLERVIAKVRRVGFADQQRVLRPADVIVFRHRPSVGNQEPQGDHSEVETFGGGGIR